MKNIILLILINTSFINSSFRSSSTSNNSGYLEICFKASTNEYEFKTFRQNHYYKSVVENMNFAQGLFCANYIKKNYGYLLPFLKQLCQDDKIGDPLTHFYPTIGFECSPTMLRYLKITGDLKREFPNLQKFNIVEIGGGFGGQCKIIHDTIGFDKYTIVDLNECISLARKYLTFFNLNNISYIPNTKIKPQQYDLVISNYAFSEIDKIEQKKYLENIINSCKNGYMIYNHRNPNKITTLTVSEFTNILKDNNKLVKVAPEPSVFDKENMIIIWKSK